MRDMRLLRRLAAAATTALLLFACAKDSPSALTRVGPPAQLSVVSGDAQSGIVGQELSQPLVVKVVDANGSAIQGQVVNFRVTAGGGSVFAGSANTNAEGVAQERWTLGTTAGAEQTVEARAVDSNTGQALVFATLHATALAGPASALAIVTQPGASAKVGVPLSPQPVVRLLDRFGNAVRQIGVTVSASISPSAGYTLSGNATVQTNNDGVATFDGLAPSGAVGSITLNFTSPSLTSISSSAITLTAGTPGSLVAVTATPASGVVGANLPAFLVKASDGVGNPVAGVTVTFTGSSGSNWSSTSMATNSQGQAGFIWTLPKTVGTYTVTASATGLSGSPIVFTGTATPASATHIAIVSGNGFIDTVGKAAPPLVVRVTDDYGNVVPGTTVNWQATTLTGGGAPTLSGSSSVTDSDGRTQIGATLQMQTGSKNTGTANVIASLASGASVTFSLTAIAGPAFSIEKNAGDAQSAAPGTTLPIPIVVSVYDRYHNPTISPVSFAITSGGGSLSLTSQTSDLNGIASTSWTLGWSTGTQQLTVSAGGASVTFSAIALGLQLSIVQQPPASGDATFVLNPAPVVRLVDGSGQIARRNAVPITVSVPAPWVVSGVTTMPTTGDGVATFTIAIAGPAQPVPLSFSATGVGGVTSATVALTSQRSMSLSWNFASGGNAPAGTRLIDPMTLRVVDGGGQPVPNVIVTFAVISGGGTITTFDQYLVIQTEATSAAQTTDANGQAMVRTWTLGSNPGPNVVRATVGNVSIDFTMNGVPH